MTAERFHFIGVCGRAMGSIAIALARVGQRVTGSDEGMYEPMNGCLRQAGIQFAHRYNEANVPADVDLVVVGKRVTDDNRELQAVIRRGLPFESFPKLLRRRFLERSRNAVIAGGVGKTTTAAMLTWILEHAGARPDYLIGGTARNLQAAARFDGGGLSVLEGDEYASCFDDETPKFLHYAPELVIVTNLLADHPDLYPDTSDLHDAFQALLRLLPAHGRLILSSDDDEAGSLAQQAGCTVVTTGLHRGADLPVTDLRLSSQGSAFRIGTTAFDVPVFGQMNVRNAAMAAAAAVHFGVSLEQSARALGEFEGVDNRQEGRDVGGCTLVTDKASHPQSIGELCQALRQRYPGRRLICVIQPRGTGGKNWTYQRDLPKTLAGFDKVILTSAYEHKPPQRTAWQTEPFCTETLAGALKAASVDVTTARTVDDVPRAARNAVQDGDVVLLCLREQFVGHVAAVEAALEDRRRTAAVRRRPRKNRETRASLIRGA